MDSIEDDNLVRSPEAARSASGRPSAEQLSSGFHVRPPRVSETQLPPQWHPYGSAKTRARCPAVHRTFPGNSLPPSPPSTRHSHILLAVDAVGNRVAMDAASRVELPEEFPRVHVEGITRRRDRMGIHQPGAGRPTS